MAKIAEKTAKKAANDNIAPKKKVIKKAVLKKVVKKASIKKNSIKAAISKNKST